VHQLKAVRAGDLGCRAGTGIWSRELSLHDAGKVKSVKNLVGENFSRGKI